MNYTINVTCESCDSERLEFVNSMPRDDYYVYLFRCLDCSDLTFIGVMPYGLHASAPQLC